MRESQNLTFLSQDWFKIHISIWIKIIRFETNTERCGQAKTIPKRYVSRTWSWPIGVYRISRMTETMAAINCFIVPPNDNEYIPQPLTIYLRPRSHKALVEFSTGWKFDRPLRSPRTFLLRSHKTLIGWPSEIFARLGWFRVNQTPNLTDFLTGQKFVLVSCGVSFKCLRKFHFFSSCKRGHWI